MSNYYDLGKSYANIYYHLIRIQMTPCYLNQKFEYHIPTTNYF